MKKLLVLLAVLTLSFTLTACNGEEDLPETMTMAELDGFLGRSDVQYIDLRNFDERMKAGYIEGFEVIPYFDYLKYQGILSDANGGWVFDTGEIGSQASMREMFNEDKTILLMCGSGTRAEYVKAALESLGYENVINIGGYADYVTADGEAVVLGGEAFTINMDVKGDYTPGTYFGLDEDSGYFVTVTINAEGGIGSVVFDALYVRDSVVITRGDAVDGSEDTAEVTYTTFTTKQAAGEDYNMRTALDLTWGETADLVAEAVIANQGWDTDWVIIEGDFDLDDADTVDAVAGVTISVDGLLIAWLEAIGQAE